MPRDKTQTHEKILPAAMAEFLDKGFEKATMRGIADKVGIAAASLYRHFTNKEDLFAALVDPVLEQCNAWYSKRKKEDYEYLEQGNLDGMWSDETELRMMVEVVYSNYDVFKLLVCRSEGTKYSNWIHELVLMEEEETVLYMETAKAKGVPVKEVRREELHLLMTAYVTAMFEVVVHDFTKEEAFHYIKTLEHFFTPGWRAVLGL